MITFKEFLSEVYIDPLFHGTSLDNALDIIKTNELRGRTPQQSAMFSGEKYDKFRQGRDAVYGVSFSRVFAVSDRFGSTIIEFDRGRVKRNNILVPFSWYHESPATNSIKAKQVGARSIREITPRGLKVRHNSSEFEEFMLGNLSRAREAIRAIYIDENIVKHQASNIKIIKQNNIKVYSFDPSKPSMRNAVEL